MTPRYEVDLPDGVQRQPLRTTVFLPPADLESLLESGTAIIRHAVIPLDTWPHTPPFEMVPWLENSIPVTYNGTPCWSGFHPSYPNGEKWFSNEYGPVGRTLRISGLPGRRVVITSIEALETMGVWYWAIGIKLCKK